MHQGEGCPTPWPASASNPASGDREVGRGLIITGGADASIKVWELNDWLPHDFWGLGSKQGGGRGPVPGHGGGRDVVHPQQHAVESFSLRCVRCGGEGPVFTPCCFVGVDVKSRGWNCYKVGCGGAVPPVEWGVEGGAMPPAVWWGCGGPVPPAVW